MAQHKRAKRMPAEQRRKLIIQAAIKLFGATNYRVATTIDIAKAAKISQANVFKYFSTKQALYIAALDSIIDRTLQRWDLAVVDVVDPLEAFLALNNLQNETITDPEYQAEFRLLYLAVAETESRELVVHLRQLYSRMAVYLAQLIERAKDAEQIRSEVDSMAAGWQIIGLFQHQLLLLMLNNEPMFIHNRHAFLPLYLRAVGFKDEIIEAYLEEAKLA